MECIYFIYLLASDFDGILDPDPSERPDLYPRFFKKKLTNLIINDNSGGHAAHRSFTGRNEVVRRGRHVVRTE